MTTVHWCIKYINLTSVLLAISVLKENLTWKDTLNQFIKEKLVVKSVIANLLKKVIFNIKMNMLLKIKSREKGWWLNAWIQIVPPGHPVPLVALIPPKNEGNKPCKCSGCGEKFNSKASFWRHKRHCIDPTNLDFLVLNVREVSELWMF